MKKNLIIDVARSFAWSDEDKDNYVSTIKKEFENYKCTVMFSDSEETTFQLLGETNKLDKDTLKSIIYLKDMEAELKNAYTVLKFGKSCNTVLGGVECERLGIKRENILNAVLSLYKDYVLENKK